MRKGRFPGCFAGMLSDKSDATLCYVASFLLGESAENVMLIQLSRLVATWLCSPHQNKANALQGKGGDLLLASETTLLGDAGFRSKKQQNPARIHDTPSRKNEELFTC